jgi:hypothetical protein
VCNQGAIRYALKIFLRQAFGAAASRNNRNGASHETAFHMYGPHSELTYAPSFDCNELQLAV